MPSGRHDHEIGRDRRGNPSRDRSSVGDRNSKGTGLRDKREPTKELRQAPWFPKGQRTSKPKDPNWQGIGSTDANDATRYGVGALASAGSPEQRNAIAGQTDDINSGDGLGAVGSGRAAGEVRSIDPCRYAGARQFSIMGVGPDFNPGHSNRRSHRHSCWDALQWV